MYGGTLARLMGEAILAFCGAPIAHEDDPERECRARLDIVSGTKARTDTAEKARGGAARNRKHSDLGVEQAVQTYAEFLQGPLVQISTATVGEAMEAPRAE
jgi:hypothetical protein